MSVVTVGVRRAIRGITAAACMSLVGIAPSALAQPAETPAGLRILEPAARLSNRPARVALLITPSSPMAGAIWAMAHGEARDAEELFTRLGFRVISIGPANRVDLVRTLRAAGDLIPLGAEVVVMARGIAISAHRDVFLQPLDAAAPIAPAALETDAVRLGDFVRRLSSRAPVSLVVLVNECHGSEIANGCPPDIFTDLPATLMVTGPRGARPDGPRSIHSKLAAAMQTEGATLGEFAARFGAALTGSDPTLRVGTIRHPAFAFMPAGFHASLIHPCNTVNREADAVAAREVRAQPLLTACENANRLWPSSHFQRQLLALREQVAFRQAVLRCSDDLAARSYQLAYPSGRYLSAVNAFRATCEANAAEERRKAEVREQQRQEEARRREAEARARELPMPPRPVPPTPEPEVRPSGQFRFVYDQRTGRVNYDDGRGSAGTCRVRAWGNMRSVRGRLGRNGTILIAYETEPHGTALREVPLRQICH